MDPQSLTGPMQSADGSSMDYFLEMIRTQGDDILDIDSLLEDLEAHGENQPMFDAYFGIGGGSAGERGKEDSEEDLLALLLHAHVVFSDVRFPPGR